MDRVFASGASATPPAAPGSPSSGYAAPGNPGAGTQATKPGAYWFHMITESLRQVIVDAGLTPDHTNLTLISQAIQSLGKQKPGTLLMWPTPSCPSWALVRDGAAVSRTSYAALFAALCPTRSGTTTNGSAAITGLSTTTDLYIGMPVEGTGIPAGATIASITSTTAITISANATASGTVPIRLFYYGYGNGGSGTTFGLPDDRGLFERGLDTGARSYDATAFQCNITSGSAVVTGLSSTKGLFVGMSVVQDYGSGLPGGATIASITSSTSVTLSANCTVTGQTGLKFIGGQIGNERADDIRPHLHDVITFTTSSTTANGGIASASGGNGGFTTYPSVQGIQGVQNNKIAAETRPRNRAYLPIIVY